MKNINEIEAGFETPQNQERYYQFEKNQTEIEKIPKELPTSYRQSNERNNCNNCNFFLNNFCNFWGAAVRGYHENPWICSSWVSKKLKQELRIDNQGNPIALDD